MNVNSPELAGLTPQRRAEVIYAQARSEISNRLWRAALGDGSSSDRTEANGAPQPLSMDSLLQLLGGDMEERSAARGAARGSGTGACHCCGCHCCSCNGGADEAAGIAAPPAPGAIPAAGIGGASRATGMNAPAATGALGVNSRFQGMIAAAAADSGVPAGAIASIVDAEAARNHDGSWNTLSRNPRSSAAGLGQFLSGTWQDMAQTGGTWLNQVAEQRGWIDENGRVRASARADLLALRYDPEASIRTVADYARINLDKLNQSGVRVWTDSETVAKAAYLSHHLGLGDARRFLDGGIVPERARALLAAQIGSQAAERRIELAGSATAAHREWLLGYIDRRINPAQFNG